MRQRRRRDVEGLRAVAVLAVILYHAGLDDVAGGYVGVDVFFVVSGFLITGLLWREVGETGRVSFSDFYARRARRLLPGAALVIACTLVAAARWVSPLERRDIGGDAVASALYVVNYRFARASTGYLDATGTPSPLQHYWSLSVEEQFYLLWPMAVVALAWLARRRGTRAVIVALASVAAVSLAVSVSLTSRAQPWAFFSLPTRAWEFVVGALLAMAGASWSRLRAPAAAAIGWCGLAAVVWSAVAFDARTAFPGVAATVPVLGTAAVLVAGAAHDGAGPGRLLGVRPLQLVGRISYAWYLWHWPLLTIGAVMAQRPLRLWEGLALSAGAGVLAALTTVLVEAPIRYSERLSRAPRPALAIAALLTIVTAAMGVAFADRDVTLHGQALADAPPLAHVAGPSTTGSAPADASPVPVAAAAGGRASGEQVAPPTSTVAPTTTDPVRAALDAAVATAASAARQSTAMGPVPANLTPSLDDAHDDRAAPFLDGCFAGFRDASANDCTYGTANTAARIVLFGDSHATAWFPAFEPLGATRGWQLENQSKATCPPLSAPVWAPNFGRTYRECEEWRAAVLGQLATSPPMMVVLAANRAYGPAYRLQQYGPEWLAGLGDMVSAVRATGSRVMVIGPVPRMPNDVPECLAVHLDAVTLCQPPLAEAVDAAGVAAERAVVEAAGGSYLDVTPAFCDEVTCAAVVGNVLVFSDQNHLTTEFAGWLSPVISAAVDDAMRRP